MDRQIQVVRQPKAAVPVMSLVSSGLTYLKEPLPQVCQALVRQGWTDFAGIGRMVLFYSKMVADSLGKGKLETKLMKAEKDRLKAAQDTTVKVPT